MIPWGALRSMSLDVFGCREGGRGVTHGLVVDDTIATATIEDEYLDATGLGTELRKA